MIGPTLTCAPGARPGGPGGPGGGGGQGGSANRGPEPLVALDDPIKPLRSKLLKVPAFRDRYLRNVRTLAQTWLDWNKLGPVADQFRTLTENEVKADTRKRSSNEAFTTGLEGLKTFADQRRAYLLNHPDIKNLPAE